MKIFRDSRRREAGFGHPPGWFLILILILIGVGIGCLVIKHMIKVGFRPASSLISGLGVTVLVIASPWIISWLFEKRKARRH
jgi:hypothetical protein